MNSVELLSKSQAKLYLAAASDLMGNNPVIQPGSNWRWPGSNWRCTVKKMGGNGQKQQEGEF